jgi:hypothetical protein
MNGPKKSRLHDYEAVWFALLVEMGVATQQEAHDAMCRASRAKHAPGQIPGRRTQSGLCARSFGPPDAVGICAARSLAYPATSPAWLPLGLNPSRGRSQGNAKPLPPRE